jgi:Protein of unknown function (DUF2516)
VQLQDIASYVLFVIQIGVLFASVYAFVHAAMQRTDAYPAAEKLTKPIWLAILGGTGLVGVFLAPPIGSAIAACAVGVYLVDVRPRILEVQGKSR